MTGLSTTDDVGAEETAARLLAIGTRNVIITLGKNGACYANASTTHMIEAIHVDVIDTTGAGDAYTGAFAAALADHRSIDEAVTFAGVAAALAVTKEGAQASLATRADAEARIPFW